MASGMFVAGASNSETNSKNTNMMYSADGVSWTSTPSAFPDATPVTDVTYGNGRFVAVNGSSDSVRSMYSNDGITWQASGLPQSATWTAIAYGGDRFVALASSAPGSLASAKLRIQPTAVAGRW